MSKKIRRLYINAFATLNWHEKYIYSRFETLNVFIYPLKINQLHICITLPHFYETLQRWEAENTSLSNKLLKINCQNWGEEKNPTPKPKSNKINLLYHICPNPPASLSTHIHRVLSSPWEVPNPIFLHGSSGLLFHYCSSSSHQLRVEKLSKFPQNDKVAIKHGRYNLDQVPIRSRMQWSWLSPVWLRAPPGIGMGTQSPCAGCLQMPQTHTANRCQTGL